MEDMPHSLVAPGKQGPADFDNVFTYLFLIQTYDLRPCFSLSETLGFSPGTNFPYKDRRHRPINCGV
jgi:hypothetical protein